MKKTTVISLCILFVLLCSLIGFAIGSPGLWTKYFSHWIVPSSIAFIMTLLVGLVLMDDLFAPPLSILNAATIGVELFGEKGLKDLIAEMNESIFKQEKEVA